MPPIQLIAVHRVHYAKDKVAAPGSAFEVDADVAEKLVASKAARRVKVEAAIPSTPKAGPRTKRATAPVQPKVEVAAEADDETLI